MCKMPPGAPPALGVAGLGVLVGIPPHPTRKSRDPSRLRRTVAGQGTRSHQRPDGILVSIRLFATLVCGPDGCPRNRAAFVWASPIRSALERASPPQEAAATAMPWPSAAGLAGPDKCCSPLRRDPTPILPVRVSGGPNRFVALQTRTESSAQRCEGAGKPYQLHVVADSDRMPDVFLKQVCRYQNR
jgi:hypothetical protein